MCCEGPGGLGINLHDVCVCSDFFFSFLVEVLLLGRRAELVTDFLGLKADNASPHPLTALP